MIDPVGGSSSSITQQTKKRPLEDDNATTGAYLQLVLHTRLSILDLFFFLFALYALNTHTDCRGPGGGGDESLRSRLTRQGN